MSRFNNKVALITGGGTGIGRAVAEAIVAEGGKVVVTGRREEPLKSLSAEHPDSIRYISADVAAKDGPAKAVAFVVEQFGQLDVLVNNAGVAILGPLVETNDDAIDLIYDVNVKGLLRVTREAVPHLIKTKGAVVNISSIAGDAAIPGASVYASSKAAVQHIAKSLAVELGAVGVRLNTVAPGFTETAMSAEVPSEMRDGMVSQTPLGRPGKPADIARAVTFLASDDAGWITGQTLQSSGGLLL